VPHCQGLLRALERRLARFRLTRANPVHSQNHADIDPEPQPVDLKRVTDVDPTPASPVRALQIGQYVVRWVVVLAGSLVANLAYICALMALLAVFV
jgi:hypothetical protein